MKRIWVLIPLMSAFACAHHPANTKVDRDETSMGFDPSSQKVSRQAGARTPSSNVFDWPVDSARMSRGFLPHKRRPHLGIDLAAPKGTPILAAQSGLVIYCGKAFKGFGQMIMIEGKDGWATLYGHLQKFTIKEGQQVQMGDMIGTMGRTGRATGVHLHFEIRRDRFPVDPLDYLPGGHGMTRQAEVPGSENKRGISSETPPLAADDSGGDDDEEI